MKASIRVVLLTGLAAAAAPLWSAEPAAYPAGTLDKQDAKVLAFYESQCTRWADDAGLSGGDRDAYMQKCLANAPKVYPVGYGPPSSGGE